MGVGARGAWAALIVAALLVLALLKAAADGAGPHGSPDTENLVPSGNRSAARPENVSAAPANPTSQPSSAATPPATPATTPRSSVAKTQTVAAPPPPLPSTVAARSTAPAGSANRTHGGPASQSTTRTPPATGSTAARNTSATSGSSAPITPTINSKGNPGSKFDTGSFLGGIVLTLGVLSILYIGCRTYYSRRGIRYRTIDEHDAII